jgi:hypothetical protein
MILLQQSAQVDNILPVPAAENHNQVATEQVQSWESEYFIVRLEMKICYCGLHIDVCPL